MEKCAKNKVNRGQVQLHQRTGSRSDIAHQYTLRPKYKNMDPDPVDFFEECMNSLKNGRTLANEIYEHMVAEKEREPEEGEAQKSPSKIVADSLSQISRSSTFLPNIRVAQVSKSAWSTSTAVEARLQAQFETTLKQKERKLLGSRKSWKHSFLLNRPHFKLTKQHLKKTKICCARPKKK